MRSPAQALGNGVLHIRHRRVLASAPCSASGFLCVCLAIGKAWGNKSSVGDQIVQSTPCIYGVRRAFVQAHAGCIGRVHRRAWRSQRAIGRSRRLVDPVLARDLSRIARTFAKPALRRGRAASEIGSGSSTLRRPRLSRRAEAFWRSHLGDRIWPNPDFAKAVRSTATAMAARPFVALRNFVGYRGGLTR